MTPRPRITKLTRVRCFDRHHGRCHLCGLRIHAERGEKWDVSHIHSRWAGGTDNPDNLAPAHKACHRTKTDQKAPQRSKETRQRAKHLGIKGSGPKLPAGRDSKDRKTIRGEVIERKSQAELHRETMAKRGFA